jgi:hypothetical protein
LLCQLSYAPAVGIRLEGQNEIIASRVRGHVRKCMDEVH